MIHGVLNHTVDDSVNRDNFVKEQKMKKKISTILMIGLVLSLTGNVFAQGQEEDTGYSPYVSTLVQISHKRGRVDLVRFGLSNNRTRRTRP